MKLAEGVWNRYFIHMRTNIDIDSTLLAAAMELSGAKTKREAVRLALEDFVRVGRQAEIKKWRGKLHWEGDLEAMRLD